MATAIEMFLFSNACQSHQENLWRTHKLFTKSSARRHKFFANPVGFGWNDGQTQRRFVKYSAILLLDMGRKKDHSFLIMVLVCSTAGAVLFGTASWAESNSCLQDEALTPECLTKNPATKTLEGVGLGLVAGVGAAVGATWNARRR